jgi:hypothetical protein
MKELSIEQMEMVSGGGCSFMEMMFYASAQLYHIGGLQGASDWGYAYHGLGIANYTEKLVGCM